MAFGTPISHKDPQTPPINRQLQQNPRPEPCKLLSLVRPRPRQRPKHNQSEHHASRRSRRNTLPLRSRIRKPNRHRNERKIERKPRHEAHALEHCARRRERVEDLVGHGRAHVLDGPGKVTVADRARDVEEVAEQVEEATGDDEEVLHEEVGLWRVEASVRGLDYEMGTLKGAGEFEGHGC